MHIRKVWRASPFLCKPSPTRRDMRKQRLSEPSIRRLAKRMNFSLYCVHCHEDGTVNQLCICSGCGGRTYHKSCWPEASFHLVNRNPGVCKPPVDYVEYVWINYLLKSQTEPEDQAKLHRSDLWSSWFNVPNRQGRAKLYVYPRPQTLINKAQAVRDGSRPFEQYPSLVSFFGETG